MSESVERDDALIDERIARFLRGEADDAELAQLAAWRASSPERERHYRQLERLLETAHALGIEHASRGTLPTAAEIIARAGTRRTRPLLVRHWMPWAVAAAASIVAAVALARPWTSVPGPDAGGLAAAAAPAAAPTEVVTGAADMTTVQLGDGSVVRLGPRSRLRVAAGGDREVELEGRAFFAVRRVPGRPLRVRTRGGEARVLGTRFELATEGDRLHLRVVEGRVALRTPRNEVEVRGGEESGVRDGAAARPMTYAGGAGVWVGRFLAFQATPLRDVARDIEQVYRVSVAVADSALAAETITATFTDRPLTEVVNVVCAVLSARCELRGDTVAIGR